MGKIALLMLRLQVALVLAVRSRRRDDRGDVPGWVMVTVMSAGLVMVIWGVAQGELKGMVRSALHSVR